MLKVSLTAIAVLSCLGLTACSEGADESKRVDASINTIYDFEEASITADAKLRNIDLSLVTDERITHGSQALQLMFNADFENSAVDFTPDTPWNWSHLGDMNVAFDAMNTSDVSLQLFIKLVDKYGEVQNRSISIPPKQLTTYYIDLSGEQISVDSGLRADPAAWPSAEQRIPYMTGKKLLDISAIKEISFAITTNLENKTLILDNIRARSNPPINNNYLVGLVDEFGQPAKTNYRNKVKSDEHLKQLAKEELADLEENPVLADRSRYGGWKDGPKLAATGFFRTEKVDGIWALVDPDGYLFFSSGIANIRIANTTTFTGIDFNDDTVRYIDPEDVTPEDSLGIRPVSTEAQKTRYLSSELRRKMFNWLPDYEDDLANHYSYRRSSHKGPLPHGETYSFYQANLERRYGETYPDSYIDAWEEVTIKRMRSWGMTSFGNWVDPEFYHKNQFPYFANGWIIGDFKTITDIGHGWSAMPDPYDPEFKRRAQVTVKVVADEVKNNPWCIGVFIDNEKSWGNPDNIRSHYSIPIQAFELDAEQSPGKTAFIQLLQNKYDSVDALNAAWQTTISSWSHLGKRYEIKHLNDEVISDLSMMLEDYAEMYFKTVHDALAEVMPDHMYMGVRMAAWSVNPEGTRAAKKYVDVMSYNFYREGLHPKIWEFLADYDVPSLIGEYHMGAMDTGLYHPGLIHAVDQKDRARMYKEYMKTVIDNPYMVGAHWFQYTDSPVTGRAYDGENYNVGFVTNADVPYIEMVEAAREINTELYPRRFKSDN